MGTLLVSGNFTATTTTQSAAESFTALQQSINWHLLPYALRTATDSYAILQTEFPRNTGDWRVGSSYVSPFPGVVYNSSGGTEGSHPNGVIEYIKICSPTNVAIQNSDATLTARSMWDSLGIPNTGIFGISNWSTTGGNPNYTITSDPSGVRAVNCSWNGTVSTPIDISTARIVESMQNQWNVIHVFSGNNGASEYAIQEYVSAKQVGLLVTCLEDSGTVASGSWSTLADAGLTGMTDFPTSWTTYPDLTITGCTWDSYAAPVVTGAVRRFQAYYSSKTAAQIRSAFINSRGANRNLDCYAAYLRLEANLD